MSAFRLPRLRDDVPIVDPKTGNPTVLFMRWQQSFAARIEIEVGALEAAQLAQAAVVTVQALVVTAQTAATTAQTSATGANSVASLTSSGTTGCTITATDAGANVTVTISAHSRVYGNGTTVAVNSGSVTALAYSTLYYMYYDQVSRAGGAVTYLATTSEGTAAQTGDRHLVGKVTTPAAAGPPNAGAYVRAPGVGDIP